MDKQHIVIIGSGLGGLTSGLLLAKNGYNVTILEQGVQIGGCLQCFKRGGVKFETGMHFIGSAAKGQVIHKLMTYFGLIDKVQLSPLDTGGYNVIALNGKRYRFANGREAFIEELAKSFPKQRDNLATYYDLIKKVAQGSSLHSMNMTVSNDTINTEYQLRSINEVVNSIITDPELAKVLVGDLPLYAAEKDKTPFSTHAFIADFYNQSAYRIVGGSDKIIDVLLEELKQYGAVVRTKSKATKIICDETHAIGVQINDEEVLEANYIISDAHPVCTLKLLEDTCLIRPAFRKRVSEMEQTVGAFSVYLKFKEGKLPYMNYNFFGYNTETPWGCENYDEISWPKGYLYMHLCHEENPVFAESGVILSYMNSADVATWKGTKIGHRGADYEKFKVQKAEKLIASLTTQFPELRDSIDTYYTATPLTYEDYTGTKDGSMYGVAHSILVGSAGRIPQRTKVPNVFQTGQNINSHGMLGVLVGTIVTCSELLGMETIYRQITEANK